MVSAGMQDAVYKIFTQAEWETFQETSRFKGSELDLQDGFIHLSAREQVDGVIERFFQGIRPLYVAGFSSPRILEHLKWEASGSDGIYPHLYGSELLVDDVVDIVKRQ